MHLVAEVLDKQILDAGGQKSGKADGLIAEIRPGKPPLLTAIEISPITLLGRVSLRLARWYASIDRHLGAGRGVPYRVSWSAVTVERTSLAVDLDAEDTPIMAAEHWARKRIARIPGA
jgi:hypothetical protein